MVWLANPERYGQMQYRYCGNSGLRLPALSLGLWHNFGHVNALESQRAILRKAFDLGITHFDLANNYGPPPGSAEENFGRLLREDFAAYRDELIISTKAGYDMWPGPYGSGGSPPLRWLMRYKAVRRCMSGSPLTRQSGRKKWSSCCTSGKFRF